MSDFIIGYIAGIVTIPLAIIGLVVALLLSDARARRAGESDKEFQSRAADRAAELEELDGMRESCRQYRG